jgi:lipopolysaccharide transport system ATP-binding protein
MMHSDMASTAPPQCLTVSPKPLNPEIVLSVQTISKRLCRNLKRSLFYGVRDIVAEVLGNERLQVDLRKGEFWALKDVSFELKRGEALGLVGANGAGKTTLLRIISGLIKPDHGAIDIYGRVAPLIALGAGFNPILTGRENIYVNMAILGLSRSEIEARFADVVAFAEIGEAIDAPVQSYSSGMAARLGFASAIHTSPDILLIDEVLAVGDMKFRTKCYRRLAELRKSGTTFILVSHSPQSILSICDRAIYLKKGTLVAEDHAAEVIRLYENDLFPTVSNDQKNSVTFSDKGSAHSTGIGIIELFFRNDHHERTDEICTGTAWSLCLRCRADQVYANLDVSVLIRELNGEGEPMLNLVSSRDGVLFESSVGINELRLTVPFCGLNPGTYTAKIVLSQCPNFYVYDAVESFVFQISGSRPALGSLFNQSRTWLKT